MASNQTKSGHRLGTFIESLGISKKEFTRRTGLDYAHLHKITTGSNDPGFETCCKISEAYPELSLTWLITGEGEMKNISREERNDIQRVKAWRDENTTDTSAVLYLFKTEQQDNKSLISSLRHKGVFDEQVIKRLKGILLELFIERRELWSSVYEKYKNEYALTKKPEELTEEEILDDMHGSPELKGLDEYIASFCRLGGKSQSQQIVTEYFKTRK